MNTPVLKLPYPASSDTADVPRDLKALAETTESSLAVPVLSVLPASGLYDGRTVDLLFPEDPNASDATGSGVWRLRYDTSITDTYKWRFVGGSEYAVHPYGPWDAANTTDFQYDPELLYTVPFAGWWDVFPTLFGSYTATTPDSYLQAGIWTEGTDDGGGNGYMGETHAAAPDTLLSAPSGRLRLEAGWSIRTRYELITASDTLQRANSSRLLARPYRVG